MSRKTGRHLPLQPPIADEALMVSKDITFRVRITNANHALKILRFLITKFYCYRDTWTEKDSIIICYTAEWFKSYRNPGFYKSAKKWLALSLLTGIYREFEDELPSFAKAQVDILLPQVRFSPRAYLGMKGSILTNLLVRDNRRLRKRPPPLAYIGVGYRDKGATRFSHLDGSPSWQTVASVTPLEIPLGGFDSQQEEQLCCELPRSWRRTRTE